MDSQIDQADFEQLLSRFSEGGLDPSERTRLGLLIESDQTRRLRYLEYCQIHAILRSEHGLLTAWTPPTLAGTALYVRDRKTIMALDLK